ncbi:MAG: hypothetical protein U0Q22_00770 [Acidimicrobiales bacterium]
MADTAPDADPQRAAVYAAEDSVIADVGRRLRRWVEVEAFVESVLTSERYLDSFPDGPLEVLVDRRSRGARASLAVPTRNLILIRDGSWNVLTVLHELAHLLAPDDPPHGPAFVATELVLVRDHCGFAAYGALRSAFEAHGVHFG